MRLLSVRQAVSCLRAQQIIALPTDTIYGMSSLVTPILFRRLCALKKRPQTHSFVILVESALRARTLVDSLNTRDSKDLLQERTTWLLRASTAPSWLARSNKIAVRVCQHPVIQAVCTELNAPIFSTSLNRHQEPACISIKAIYQSALAGAIAGVVPDVHQNKKRVHASTIRDMATKAVIRT